MSIPHENNFIIQRRLVEQFEYDIEIVDNGNIFEIDDASKLIINLQETENTLEFKKKRNSESLVTIPLGDIEAVTPITIITKHRMLLDKKCLLLEIVFKDNQENKRSVRLDIEDKYISVLQEQINLLKDASNNLSFQKAIAALKDPTLCSVCIENKFIYGFHSSKLCLICFEEEYDKILLQADKDVNYHHGHKDHVGGGKQPGKVYLTENYFIFAKEDKDIAKKWEIVIPLNSVILNWNLEEKERQKHVQWEGTTFNNFGFGSGFIRESGKNDYLVVPYIDGNSSPQEPEFSIPEIQNWAAQLYRMTIKTRMNLLQTENIPEKDIPQTTANCFNCGRQFEIYELVICNHCITSFCDICIGNHPIESENQFFPKYLGGHKLYPKSLYTKVYVFSDRLEIAGLNLRIPYTSINDIENADEKKITAKRLFLVGVFAFAWKKKDLYTIIEYTDGFNKKQTLVFDFEKKIEEAQQKIYDRMLASHFAKERLLESQKIDNNMKDQKLSVEDKTSKSISLQHKINSIGEIMPESKTSLQKISDDSTILQPNKIDKPADDYKENPLHLLKIRLAKGEINKEDYEEMRKMIES
jgi:hypothetical protein